MFNPLRDQGIYSLSLMKPYETLVISKQAFFNCCDFRFFSRETSKIASNTLRVRESKHFGKLLRRVAYFLKRVSDPSLVVSLNFTLQFHFDQQMRIAKAKLFFDSNNANTCNNCTADKFRGQYFVAISLASFLFCHHTVVLVHNY